MLKLAGLGVAFHAKPKVSSSGGEGYAIAGAVLCSWAMLLGAVCHAPVLLSYAMLLCYAPPAQGNVLLCYAPMLAGPASLSTRSPGRAQCRAARPHFHVTASEQNRCAVSVQVTCCQWLQWRSEATMASDADSGCYGGVALAMGGYKGGQMLMLATMAVGQVKEQAKVGISTLGYRPRPLA
eukprot:725450-Rhodomonas_salina.3